LATMTAVVHAQPQEAATPPKAMVVTLTVDYGDGVQKVFPEIPYQDEMTVFDVMKFAQQHPRGISCKVRGKDSTALLTQIDDLSNQGARAKNWVFRVNGKLGKTSFGVVSLKPGDIVLWKFERYR